MCVCDYRKIYGDHALGEANLEMIEIARKVNTDVLDVTHTHTICKHTHMHTQYGSSAKFSGSGGAIIGICLDQVKKVSVLNFPETAIVARMIIFLQLPMVQEFRSKGFVFCDLTVYSPSSHVTNS